MTDSVPFTPFGSVGVKKTWIWQFAPTCRLDGQPLLRLNGGVAAICEIVTVCVPVLVNVAVCGGLVVPSSRVANVM